MSTQRTMKTCLLAFVLFFMSLSASAAPEAAAHRIALSLGAFTSLNQTTSAVGTLEYRSAFNLLSGETYLNPIVGILGNTDGGVYGYVGLRIGFPLSSPWHWENGFGFGAYSRGNGPDLSDPLEFCLSISITRQIFDRVRVGGQFFHMSNASLRELNPGANSFLGLVELAL